MSLSDDERAIIAAAGTSPRQTVRGQAVAIVLSKSGGERDEARALLAESFLGATQPSFHLIPRGDAMTSEADFVAAYDVLASETRSFQKVVQQTLAAALERNPKALVPLRMILGFTTNELAVAVNLADPRARTTGGRIKNFERRPRPTLTSQARADFIAIVARTVLTLMERELLPVPPSSAEVFHSKLDKRDTARGVGRCCARRP